MAEYVYPALFHPNDDGKIASPKGLTAQGLAVGGRYRARTYDPLHVKQVL